jgi:hypothetical protein
MAQKRELQQHIEGFISKAHDEVLRASNRLSKDLDRDSERFAQPIGQDLTDLVDDVFDFAQRVIEGQRRMITQVLKAVDDAEAPSRPRASSRSGTRSGDGRRPRKATAKTAPAKRAPARKTPATAKRTTRSKSSA